MFFGRQKSLIGLDIGSSAVKAIELKPKGRSAYRVAAIDVEPLPPHTIVGGGVAEPAAVSGGLARLLDRKRFRAKDVALSLSGHSVIVKKITLPVMTTQELSDSIHWEAEQHIPFPLHDVNLDYEVLESGTGVNGKGSMEVLLVAAKKETVDGYTTLLTQAGKRTAVVDVDAFALQNAYEVNYGCEPDAIVALLNIGATSTNLNVLAGSQSVFTRDLSVGGQVFTEALQRELQIDFDTAEQVKRGHSLGETSYEDARPVLRSTTESLIGEIEKSVDFYKSTGHSERIDRIMVSGGGSRVEGVQDALRERFGTTVEPFDPFRQIEFDRAKLGGADPAELAPISAVAVGLALRRAGDR